MEENAFLVETLTGIARVLAGARFEFALAGGLAYSALVEPRATTDLDFLILATDDLLPVLGNTLAPFFDAVIPHESVRAFKKARLYRIVGIQGKREILIDFILADTNFHRSALKRSRTVALAGTPLPIVTLEDLILLKALADRPQDLVDIENIWSRFMPEGLDMVYLQKWSKALNLRWPLVGEPQGRRTLAPPVL